MIHRIINQRYLAIAVLLLAQLIFALHAAEHGVGEHEHDGAPCVYCHMGDDDLALSLSPAKPRPFTATVVCSIEEQSVGSSAIAVRLPPATGPPVST